MGTSIIFCGFVGILLAQPAAAPSAPAAKQTIAQAIIDLGDARYAVRQRASRFLWQQGLAAEAALKAAAASPEIEVRLRARRVLDDFRYGILPTVPGDIIELIRLFRDGTAPQRLTALQRLASGEQFETLERLIRLEANPNTRRQLLVELMKNPRAVERFVDQQGLQRLVDLVGADQDDSWRRTLLGQLLATERILERLAEKGQLATLAKLVESEKSDQVRRQILSDLFRNQAAVGVLLEKDQLEFVLALISREPDQGQRANWLNQLVSAPRTVEFLATAGRLERLLQYAQQNLETPGRDNFLQVLTQSPAFMNLLWKNDGLDGLVKLASRETDAAARGRLLGTLISAPPVRQRLTDPKFPAAALQLARDEQDEAARNEYLKTLVSRGALHTLFRDAASRRELWQFVKADKGQDWRGDVLVQLLPMAAPDQLITDKEDAAWLLRFVAADASPQQRTQLLQRLVSDSRWLPLMLSHGRFDELLKLIKAEPANNRGNLWQQLPRRFEVAQHLQDAKRLGLLVTLAQQETDAAARRQYLGALFDNDMAMTALLDNGHYDALYALLQAEQDPVERATLFGALISTSAVLRRFTDRGELGALVAYARNEANAEARRRFLLRLLPNHLAVNALLDEGHYDALLALADGEESRAVRMTLLGACYSNVRIVERLVETRQLDKAFQFAQRDADEDCRRQVLGGLCQNERALHAVVSQGQFDTLLDLVRGDDNQPSRGMMLGALLASPRVLPALLKRNETEKFFAAIRAEEDDDVRRQVLQRVFAQGEPVLVLLEQGRLDGVLELVRLDPNAAARGQLFAQLLIRPEALQRLTAAKQLDAIVSFARGLDAVEARRSFLQQLYSQGPTVAALLEHGRFDALWKLASGETDARWQAILLGHLVANAKTVEYLVVNKQTDLLLQLFLTAQRDLQLRRNFLRQVVTDETAVAALIQHGQFDQLIQLMASSSAAGANSGLLAELLLSVPAIERLAHSGKLPQSVQAALGDPDAGQRGQLLDRLVANPRVVGALAEKGQLETLYQAVTADATPARRRQLFGSLLASSQGVQQLVATKRLDEAITQIGEEPDAGRRLSYLQRILYDASALQALLAAGRGERLLDLLPGSVREPGNASLLQAFLSNPAALRQLNAAGQFDNLLKRVQEAPDPEPRRRLVDGLLAADAGRRLLAEPRIAAGLVTLLKAEPLETTRGTHVRTALTSRCVWQSLVYSGQSDRLREIAALLPDQAYAAAQFRRMLCSPSGLVAYHLSRGEESQARQLLEQAADDDWGRVRLAAHLAAGGVIDQRLAELQRRLEQKPEAADARLLTYLARAKGDSASARRAAELTKDEGLLKAVLVEQRAWAEAGRRQAAGPCPLPIPAVERPARNPVWLHVEQLSLTAAYQRLAGQAAARDKTLAELQRLAEKPPLDKEVRWMCVEALLLNDRVAEGVALLAKTMPARAFEVLCYQQRYREALELFGWRDGAAQDPAWLENLPTVAAQHEAERVVQRVDIALHVARTLHTLGRRDDVAQLLVRIEAFVQQQPDDNSSSPLRRQCWERLSGALAAMGMTPRAWDYAARAVVGPDAAAPVLARLYARRLGEAEAWWSYFRQQAPADSVAATLQRGDRVLNPPPEEDAAEFDRLAAAAEKVAESGNPRLWQALAEACLRRGRLDVAGRAVAAVRAADSVLPEDLAWQWADALRNAQRWPEAAEQYAALWQANHDVLAALYLAGDAAEHAGRAAEGRKQKDLAHRLALDSQRRRELAVSLLTHGLRQEAVAQLQLVLRTAPCEHWEWNDAARCLGDELAESDPATAADLLQHSLLDDLRWNFYLLEPYDYVRTPAAIHRLRAKAAVASGDFAAADREIELTLAAVPCDTHVAEDLVPLLEKAARRPQAEALFERLHTAFRQRLEQYPQCALLHNNLAWLSARCHRRLAEALQHARQANELVPNNAAYLDTLAEAQFRLGDRDAAIRHSRRAVQLRPQDESLKKQLARFERDPLP